MENLEHENKIQGDDAGQNEVVSPTKESQPESGESETKVEESSSQETGNNSEQPSESPNPEGTVQSNENTEKAPEPEISSQTTAEEKKESNEAEDTATKYKKFFEEKLKRFRDLQKANWDNSPEKDGVKLQWLLDQASGLYNVKGQIDIKVAPSAIKDLILDTDKLLDWDKTVELVKSVEKIDNYSVSYSVSKKLGLVIEKRDCCVLVGHVTEENGTIILAGGTYEHPSYPAKEVPVRCSIPIWGWELKADEKDSNLTHASYLVLIDPKGWVPKQVMNAACTEQAMNIKNVKHFLEGTKAEKKGLFGFLKK